MVIEERRKRKEIWKVENRKWILQIFLLSSFLIACTSRQSTPQTQIVTINYSPFIQLDEVYACANDLGIVLKVTDENPEIRFGFGEPEDVFSQVYQIGEEELIVVVTRQSEVGNLTIEEVQNIFRNDAMQVWVYPSVSDMQKVFDQIAMQGRGVSSNAKVATSLQVMLEALERESNAIGFIPKSSLTENLKEVFSIGNFPILALTETEPQGAVKNLIGCLQ